jgi:hypothetical protein
LLAASSPSRAQTSRFAAAYYNRGNERYKKGDLDGAIADFDAALAFDNVEIIQNLGSFWYFNSDNVFSPRPPIIFKYNLSTQELHHSHAQRIGHLWQQV